jgi:hypothetical protein
MIENYTLNLEALEAYQKHHASGLVNESATWIIEKVLEQEIVSFCDSSGCVAFDIDDLVKINWDCGTHSEVWKP